MHECSHGLPALGHRECYLGLKFHTRDLTDEEAAYIGHTSTPRAPGSWRDASALGISFEVGAVLAFEDAEVLAVLMGAEHRDTVEFLA